MLTALMIKDASEKRWYKKIINKIIGDSVETELKSASGVAVKYITYVMRTGAVNWRKLDSVISSQRNHLLCDKNIVLPVEMGFKRFDNNEFKIRLSSNLFLYILSQLDDVDIKVGLYDVKGQCTDVLSHIVKYTSNFVVVTDNLTAFNYEVNNIYEEYGATVQLTGNRANLKDCSLILAPMKICEALPLSGNTIILSGSEPLMSTSGVVYYDYHFRMPNQFEGIKTDDFTEEYLCGALYTKARQYELGSIVPTSCSNNNSIQTCNSISEYLKNQKINSTHNK